MRITGDLILGGSRVSTSERFRAFDPTRNRPLEPEFSAASTEHVVEACALAEAAFDVFRATLPDTRARFLELIAQNILDIGDALLDRVGSESGLPRQRLADERARTIGQLYLFAAVVRSGDWLGLRIDPALPDRSPAPRPDLRLRQIPLGPVAVFGASNFPLAFSVAGGDTVSALAAGCPVVCKAHPAHPGTSELVGRAVAQAVMDSGLPEGVFSLLNGPTHELGAALVADPRIKAVGFTGSRAGGLALMRIAQSRPEVIPVYAEMSSINPILLMGHALERRAESLAAAFASSLTLAAGQFCTNPGMVLAVDGAALDRFLSAASRTLQGVAPAVMLTPGIQKAFVSGVEALSRHARVRTLVKGGACAQANGGVPALFATDAVDFTADVALSREVFGASAIVVRCRDNHEMRRVLEHIEGQLTLSLHLDPDDYADAAALRPLLERKAGRLIVNDWPTGVEVSHAMVHGGPYPATSDGRSTSVGTLAIARFLRPVCYQDFPDELLPTELKTANPLLLNRLVMGAPLEPSRAV